MFNTESPKDRMFLLILDKRTKHNLENHDEDAVDIINNPRFKIIDVNQIEAFLERFSVYGDINYMNLQNVMFTLSPFDPNTYIEFSKIKEIVTIETHFKTIELCQLLGAKEVSIEEAKLFSYESKEEFNLKSNYKIVTGGTSLKSLDLSVLQNTFNLSSKFETGEADYSSAEKLLKSMQNVDNKLMNLYKLRDPNSRNPIKNYKLNMNLLSSIQNTLDFVANLSFAKIVFNLNFEYKSVVSEKLEVNYCLNIEF